MGEVYRARDSKLDSRRGDQDPAGAVRGRPGAGGAVHREAKTLAALNHPHIAQIYGLEESAGVSALVMELIEGRHWQTASRRADPSGRGAAHRQTDRRGP